MNKIAALDYIRSISIIGILLCHSCFMWQDMDWLGRYFAQMFNFTFLILSAFLMGIKWEKENYRNLPVSFVTKRIKRLSSTYYPFLLIMFGIVAIKGGGMLIPWHKILAHIIYLQWFDSIEPYGHLWYLTMIVLCYIMCWIISKDTILKKLIDNKGGGIYLFGITLLTLGSAVTLKGIPGAIFFYILFYLIVFRYATTILKYMMNIKLVVWVALTIPAHGIALYLYHESIFHSNRLASYYISILTAITMFGLLLRLCKDTRLGYKVIAFISSISFEMYLIHMFFLADINIYRYLNKPIGFICLVIASAAGGYLLMHTSKVMSRLLIVSRKTVTTTKY